jgi:glycopeptide antibiotics resistance protein
MWPTPIDRGYESTITKLLGIMHKYGIPSWFGYHKLEFSANIIMFIPLGFLVTMLLSQRFWWLALVICPAMSIAIEVTQALFLSARFATVSDVISNSIGAVIGILMAILLRALVYHRDEMLIARALWQHRKQSQLSPQS